MRLDQIDPMADLDMILGWSKGTVYFLKVKHSDQYFVSLTNTVNFGGLTEAKIFESKGELVSQYDKLPIQFSRHGAWEVLKLQLETL